MQTESMIEKELKYQLTNQNYMKLKEYLKSKVSTHQVTNHRNYYLETERFELRKNGVSLRFRVKADNSVYITLKRRKNALGNNVHIKDEHTMRLMSLSSQDQGAHASWLQNKEVRAFLESQISDSDILKKIRLIGCLETERLHFELFSDIEPLLLDRSNYLDKEDYEIEWETEFIERASSYLEDIFNVLDIEAIENTDAKSRRFFREYVSKRDK